MEDNVCAATLLKESFRLIILNQSMFTGLFGTMRIICKFFAKNVTCRKE